MRVALGTGQGKGVLELRLLDGVSGDAGRDARFPGTVLEGNAVVGNLAKIKMGYFHVKLDRYRDTPLDLQGALRRKHLWRTWARPVRRRRGRAVRVPTTRRQQDWVFLQRCRVTGAGAESSYQQREAAVVEWIAEQEAEGILIPSGG